MLKFKNFCYDFLLCIFMAILFLGCAKKDILMVSSKQNDFTITLPANPTTGFKWSIIDYDKNIFELESSRYTASKVGLIGSGGDRVYIFHIKQLSKYPKFSIIKFKYSRSWEPGNSSVYRDIKVYID